MCKEMGAGGLPHFNSLAQQHMGKISLELHGDAFAMVNSALPSFVGDFDPHAYIDWELNVEAEFDKYELSDHQMILAAASALTEHAFVKWKSICRHNNIPQTWTDFKMHFRDAYIPAYYVDHLLTKLQKLKQGSRTVKQYYHDFKICVLFGGLDECMEETMSRFMRGLNSEIQTLLLKEKSSHISHLFLLACTTENQILLSAQSYKTVVTHDELHLSTLYANQEQQIVETIAYFPLSHCDFLIDP